MLAQIFTNIRLQNLHFQNVAVPLATKITTSLLYIFLVPYAVNRIGDGAYGVISFLLMLHGYVALFDSGFSYAFGLMYARSLSQSSQGAEEVARNTFSIYVFLSLISFLGFVFFSTQLSQLFFSNSVYNTSLIIFGAALAFSILDSFFLVIIQAHNQLRWINLNRFAMDLVKIGTVFLLVYFRWSVEVVLYGIVLASLTKLLLDVLAVKFLTGKLFVTLKFKLEFFKRNMRLAVGSLAVAGMSLVMSLADKTIVNRNLSSDQFAAYSFSFDLTQKSYFLMYAVIGATYPTLIRHYAAGRSTRNLIRLNLLALLLIGLGYYLSLAIFGEKILSFIVNDSFASRTGGLLPYSALAAVLYLAFNIFENHLNAQGQIKRVAAIYAIGMLVLLCSVLTLPNILGTVGAAASVVLMFFSMNIALLCVWKFRV